MLDRTVRVQRVYRGFAPFYNGFRAIWSAWTRAAESDLDTLFASRVGPESRILELGPGTGVNLARLRRRAPDFRSYLGIDASEPMLRRARATAGSDDRIELRLADVADLSAAGADGPFDMIVSTWMLSHLDDPASVVRDAVGRLGSDGTAVFVFSSTPRNRAFRWIAGHVYHALAADPIDAGLILSLPGLEFTKHYAGGLATLAVFRAEPSA